MLWGGWTRLVCRRTVGFVWNESENRLTIFLDLFSSAEQPAQIRTCFEPSGLITGPAAVWGWRVRDYQIVFRGVCQWCANKRHHHS